MHLHPALRTLILALACTLTVGVARAQDAGGQDYAYGWNPRTGDAWVDTTLDDINRYASRYRGPFIDEMTRYYDAPRDLVSDLLGKRGWAPGDVYYACALAQVVGQPCRNVVQAWERDHAQGWGVIARRMGVKPGSAEFHRLKRGVVPTYDRWARPIHIDDSLRIDFPNRARLDNKTTRGADGDPGKHNASSAHKPDNTSGDHGNSGDHDKSGKSGKPGKH